MLNNTEKEFAEYLIRRKELMSKFSESKKRYKDSAIFNHVIEQLSRNVDVYEVINLLCEICENQSEQMNKIVSNFYIKNERIPKIVKCAVKNYKGDNCPNEAVYNIEGTNDYLCQGCKIAYLHGAYKKLKNGK